jgi:predicted alpha/beta-fold hydrolase
MSDDVRLVVTELACKDRLDSISIIGYSMGGNLILKMAGEVKNHLSVVRGIYAVCPNIDPAQCILALERPDNRLYHDYFFTRLRERIRRKAAIFPDKWDFATLRSIKTIREIDHYYTAPDGGYASASHYYEVSGARHVLADIQIPTVIITSQDDPFIPSSMFSIPDIGNNPCIDLTITRYGGHCGFFQRRKSTEDNYWVENRLIEMILQHAGHNSKRWGNE